MTNVAHVKTAEDSTSPQDLIVGWFDILGFKGRLQEIGLAALAAHFEEFLRLKDWAAEIPVASPGGVVRWETRAGVVSDTILLWARMEPEAIDTFLSSCSTLMAETLRGGWP